METFIMGNTRKSSLKRLDFMQIKKRESPVTGYSKGVVEVGVDLICMLLVLLHSQLANGAEQCHPTRLSGAAEGHELVRKDPHRAVL